VSRDGCNRLIQIKPGTSRQADAGKSGDLTSGNLKKLVDKVFPTSAVLSHAADGRRQAIY